MQIDIEPVDPIETKNRISNEHMKEVAAWASGYHYSIYRDGSWRLVKSIHDFFKTRKTIRRGIILNDHAVGFVKYEDGTIIPFTYPMIGYQKIVIDEHTEIVSDNGKNEIHSPIMGEELLLIDKMPLDAQEISTYNHVPAHPQYDVIKAWSEGAMIMEQDNLSGEWVNIEPDWHAGANYAVNLYMYRNPVFRVYKAVLGNISVAKNYRIPIDFKQWLQDEWVPA